MKFKVLKSDFWEALSKVQGVVEKKNIMPILGHVLIEAPSKSSMIQLTATDLEVGVTLLCPAHIETEGVLTIAAKSLMDIVRESASEEIVIEKSEGERVVIHCKSQYKLLGLPAKEFPHLPEVTGETMRLASDEFLSMLNRTDYAMSTDETRYHLNGVLWERQDKSLVIVATDGHRLACVRHTVDLAKTKQTKIIIPRKGIAEMRKIFSTEKSFDLCVNDRHLSIKTEKQTLFVRLIDGQFPDYQRVIPKENQTKISVPREEFVGALKRVSLLSNDRSRGVSFYFCKNSLSVTSSNPELGEAKEEIDLEYTGPVLHVGFNARYFLEALSALPDQRVTLAFKDDVSPCLMTCESDPGFLSVVMPMRI